MTDESVTEHDHSNIDNSKQEGEKYYPTDGLKISITFPDFFAIESDFGEVPIFNEKNARFLLEELTKTVQNMYGPWDEQEEALYHERRQSLRDAEARIREANTTEEKTFAEEAYQKLYREVQQEVNSAQ